MKKILKIVLLNLLILSSAYAITDEERERLRSLGATFSACSMACGSGGFRGISTDIGAGSSAPQFCDIDKEDYTDVKWGTGGASCGHVHVHGLNLIGKCMNTSCEGNKYDYVVCKQLSFGDFDVIKGEKLQIKCSCTGCDSPVEPTSFAVNNCWYRVLQRKAVSELESVTKWQKIGDECRIYNEGEPVPTETLRIECKRLCDEPEHKRMF